MSKATIPGGMLIPIENCYVHIPGYGKLVVDNLPDIGDSKSSVYDGTSIMGRASPLHTYHYSDARTISIQFHFYVTQQDDIEDNLFAARALMSCAYPRTGSGGAPFDPPPICKLQCGNLLTDGEELCVVLQQYNVKWPTDVVWDEQTLCPYKFDVDTTWIVVYASSDLPDQRRILRSGR